LTGPSGQVPQFIIGTDTYGYVSVVGQHGKVRRCVLLRLKSQPIHDGRGLKNWTDYRFYNFQKFFKRGAAKFTVNYRPKPLKCPVSGYI
jgi:hypothetical protein